MLKWTQNSPRVTLGLLPQCPYQALLQTRSASHAAQGRANKAARGPGKRLGAKRGATELVVPGTIIYRQRGTKWFAGENCGMGRDHSIFAKEKGHVVYYNEPWRGKGYGGAGRGDNFRKCIGIVQKLGETLPRPPGTEVRRRLGMTTKVRKDLKMVETNGESETQISRATPSLSATSPDDQVFERADSLETATSPKVYESGSTGRALLESNWEIGRASERANIRVKKFDRGDRFLAWRKRAKRIKHARQVKALKKPKGKAGGKKSSKRSKK